LFGGFWGAWQAAAGMARNRILLGPADLKRKRFSAGARPLGLHRRTCRAQGAWGEGLAVNGKEESDRRLFQRNQEKGADSVFQARRSRNGRRYRPSSSSPSARRICLKETVNRNGGTLAKRPYPAQSRVKGIRFLLGKPDKLKPSACPRRHLARHVNGQPAARRDFHGLRNGHGVNIA